MNKIKYECPCCGRINVKAIPYLTFPQVNISQFSETAAIDETWQSYITKVGGADPQKFLKRHIFPDDAVDLTYTAATGHKETATELMCSECHNNVTPLYNPNIREIRAIPLIGLPGASKTVLLSSLFKFVTEKGSSMSVLNGTKTFEYSYYNSISSKFPEIPAPTYHTGTETERSKCRRQPLVYIKVQDVLLVFLDFPGESFKNSNYYIPKNSTPLYLYDPTADPEEQKAFYSKIFSEIHENGRSYSHEVICVVKSDTVEDTAKKIMIKPIEESESVFTTLYGTRRMRAKVSPVPLVRDIYIQLKNRSGCSNIDVVAAAALGCNAVDKDGVYKLKGDWSPKYLTDLLLTLAV